MPSLVYLYGFAPSDTESPSEELRGIDEAAVDLLEMEGFAAVVSRVPSEIYASEPLETRLKDLDWVAEQGLAHERVVTWFVDHATILPARLFTLYSSRAALEERASRESGRIAGRLEELRDAREWDLKVSYEEETLGEHLSSLSEEIGALDEEMRGTSPGKRYLLERKKSEVAGEEMRGTAREVAENLLNDLGNRVEERVDLEIPREASGLPVVLNAALLVTNEQERGFRQALDAEARRLEPLGMRVEYSGPWAPYRFVGTPDGQ